MDIQRVFLLLTFGMLFPSWAFGTELEDRLSAYKNREWNKPEIVEQAKELKAIQELANSPETFREHFFVGLELMALHNGRSMPQFNESVTLMDSLFDEHYNELQDSVVLEFFIHKGTGLLLQGYFPEALRNLQYAQELAKRSGVPDYITKAKNGFGMYYLVKRDVVKALELAKEVLQEFENGSVSDTTRWITYLGNLGVTYSWNRKYDSSNVYLKQAIGLDPHHLRSTGTQYYYLGENYLQLAQYDSSEYFIRKAIEIEKGANEKQSTYIYDLYQHLGKMYAVMGDYDRSNAYFQQTVAPLDSLHMFDQLAYAHGKMLVNDLKSRGDLEGVEMFRNFQIAKDSIRNRNNSNLEQKYLVQFETMEKEAEIKELELQQEKDNNAKIVLGGLSILTLLLLVFGWYRYRTHKTLSQQRLALKEIEAAQAQEELKQRSSELAEKINNLQLRENIIAELKSQIKAQSTTKDIVSLLEQSYIKDQSWDHIILQFENIYPDMFADLRRRSERISPNDLKLSILMKLGYSTNSIAEVLKISKEGVRKARQRLKEKVGADFIENLSD